MEQVGYIASFLMGVTLGLMGGGGSILTVPIMVYLFGIVPSVATGYSLFIVGLTALIGSLSYLKDGDVNLVAGLKFAIPSIVGVYLARSIIVPNLPDILFHIGDITLKKDMLIMALFAVLMIFASLSMIRGRRIHANSEDSQKKSSLSIGAQGLAVGLLVGFVGAGGGFLIVPALVIFSGLGMRVAVGTSLMIIAAQSLIGFMGDLRGDLAPDWHLLISVAVAAGIGIFFASRLSHKVPEVKLKKTFGWFVLLMGSTILIEQLRHF